MAGTNEEQQVWTKRTMLLALDAVRKKLGRMPERNEFELNGLPTVNDYVRFLGMERKNWGGKLKKMIPKLAKFQAEFERRKAEGELLEDSKRSDFRGRDDVIFQMEGFDRLFGFLPEKYEWEEIYLYFDIPDAETRRKFFFRTVTLQELINENYPRIARARQSAGLKSLTYADFGVSEQQPTEKQLDDVSAEIVRVLESKTEHEEPKPALAEMEEVKTDAGTALSLVVPEIFSQEVFEDLVEITKHADFKLFIGTQKWVRAVSLRLKHLITPEEIANIPGALSLMELERKIGLRQTWLKFVADVGLKDPLAKEPEEPEPKPKPRTLAEALDVSEVKMTEITPMVYIGDKQVKPDSEASVELVAEVEAESKPEIKLLETEMVEVTEAEVQVEAVDVTEEKSDEIEEDLNYVKKHNDRLPRFASKDAAVEWYRNICQEMGYQLNTVDLTKIPDVPDATTMCRYLGPSAEWGQYVKDLKLKDRKECIDTRERKSLTFGECVGLVRKLIEQNHGQIPTYREIEILLPEGPTSRALVNRLGSTADWKKYLDPEYDEIVNERPIEGNLTCGCQRFLSEQDAIAWYRQICIDAGHIVTPKELRTIPNAPTYVTLCRYIGLWDSWLECVKDLGLSENQSRDETEPNTMMEADNMEGERKVETLEEETKAVATDELADGAIAQEEVMVTKNVNVRREPVFKGDDEALASLSRLRKKLGRTVRSDDFPAGEEFASMQTYTVMLGSRKEWDALLDYYETYGCDDTLHEMIKIGFIKWALKKNEVTEDDLLKELAKLYLKYDNEIPPRSVFGGERLGRLYKAFKKCFGDMRGWRALAKDYLKRCPMTLTELATDESSAIISQEEFAEKVYPEVMEAEDPNSESGIVAEVEVATDDDSASADEAVQTVNVPAMRVKIPKDGKGAINLTLTLNLRISFDE